MIDIVSCMHVEASLLARLQAIGFIEAYRFVRKQESGATLSNSSECKR